MDGMITPRGIVRLDEGPQPYCTTDIEALHAVGKAHAARMANQATALAEACGVHLDAAFVARQRAEEAERAAGHHHQHVARKRAFLADRIRGLRDAGRLTYAQHRAAEEIGDLLTWHDAGKIIMARSQFSERLAASANTVPMGHLLAEADRLRFGPWRAWASSYPVKRNPDRTLEDMVRAFVVQDLGIRQLANAFCMDQRRAERLLLRALSGYAVLAGWEAAQKAA